MLYLNFDGGNVSYDGHTESISAFQSMPGHTLDQDIQAIGHAI